MSQRLARLFAAGAVLAAAPAASGDAGRHDALAELTATYSDVTIAYAQTLHQRLSGAPVSLSSSEFRRMLDLVAAGDQLGAARVATESRAFYDVRVKNFAASFSNKDSSPLEPFNDLMALITGVVRDQLDARLLLTGDLRYEGRDAQLAPASKADNLHYEGFEAEQADARSSLVKASPQWSDQPGAGALTTRTWAKAFYSGGTNRRAVQYAFQAFLCTPIDKWKTHGLNARYVRRDVDRAIGGDPATFQNLCRNCHAPMDAMGGAFARLDFADGALKYAGNDQIAAKMNQNAGVYPAGYTTLDDNWENLLAPVEGLDFGWRGATAGTGPAAFGAMLANSAAFGRCMAQRVAAEVCGRPITDADAPLLKEAGAAFEASGYNLKGLFERLAVRPECLAPIQGRVP